MIRKYAVSANAPARGNADRHPLGNCNDLRARPPERPVLFIVLEMYPDLQRARVDPACRRPADARAALVTQAGDEPYPVN